ncbi:uncharacterized protein LOC124499632 [Dermatophagoides farinae]|uniref:Uncharacterized protein n=1 Tax=Dermatophagoides farinae TaxID=6954 RepID=A0A9D4P734_DERFA|nr:uncharacterized protein LOC124499632 [Dermatophagoides farinae]KAH7645152.1 hypothetical protein HUG17_0690 [Dermatophagoides farinae]
MFRYIFIIAVISIVAVVFNQRYNNQKQERRRMAAIPYETPSTLVMIDNGNGDEKGSSIDSMAIQSKPLITANDDDDGANELDDYCHTICQLHQCQTGREDLYKENQCVCYKDGGGEQRCEI